MFSHNLEEPDFNMFFETFTKSGKLAKPKSNIRNVIKSPWITDAVINSIDEKERIHREWKDSCNKSQQKGDKAKHKTFSDYRRCLKHIIKSSKAKYYNNKFFESTGNPKKHGN